MSKPRPVPRAPAAVFADAIIAGSLALTAVLAALIPDDKDGRWKLAALEAGVALSLVLSLVRRAFFERLVPVPRPKSAGYRVTVVDASNSYWMSPAAWLDAAVAVWALVTAFLWWTAPDPALAEAEARRVFVAVAAYAAARLSDLSAPGRRAFSLALGGAAALAALYGVLQRTGGVGPVVVPQMDRVIGTFGNPIFFAAFLVPAVLFTRAAADDVKGTRWGLLLSIGFVLELWALYAAQTRAAWLALAATMVAALWVRWGGFGRVRVGWWFTAAILAGFWYVTRDVWARPQGHLLIWRDTLKMWAAHPWTGVGLGAFHVNFPSYAGSDLQARWPQGQFIVNFAHSEYLQALAEGGVLGFAAFAGVVGAFFAATLRMASNEAGEDDGARRGLFTAAAFAILVQNLFSVDMRFGVSSAFLFLFMGLALTPPASASAAMISQLRMGIFVPSAVVSALVFYPWTLTPHRARAAVKAAPGFFDVRVLDPARTIDDLEALRVKHPAEPALLDKLAYVYAKEIQGPDGKIRRDMAEKAVQVYDELLRSDPKRLGAYNNLANIHYTLGRPDEAEKYWRQAVEVDPNFIDARLNLGKLYYLRGQLKASAAQFQEALKRDPSNAEAISYLRRMVE